MLAINNGNHPFSYQSSMPAAAGTPGHENWRHPCLSWIPAFAGMTRPGNIGELRERGWRDSSAGRVALAGDKPQRYVLLSGLLAVDGRIDNVTRAR